MFMATLRYEVNVAPMAGVRRERKNGVAVIITVEVISIAFHSLCSA
jgi:hypothetical protein